MNFFLIALAIITLIFFVLTGLECAMGFKKIKKLGEQTVLPHDKLPMVSIILSALNEENDIEEAVLSLLKLNYPRLEIIVLNDRSTDNTPAILNNLQARYPTLKVYHIDELPPRWFGKNHALQCGANVAKGEWLLFTDADALMKPDILLKSVSYVLENHLDHLTIFEKHIRKTHWLKVLLLGNYVCYSVSCKPWRLTYAWSKKSIGHGAFNLVNADVYRQCGGHQAIAMECLDDVKLGELIRRYGYQQDTVNGFDYIERAWYHSLPDMIAGYKKNAFAVFNYKFINLIRDTFFAACIFIWPVIAAIFCTGLLCWLNIAIVLVTFALTVWVAKQFRLEKRYAFFYPLSIIMLLYTLWNSALTIYRNKGVVWRGTHYSFKQ